MEWLAVVMEPLVLIPTLGVFLTAVLVRSWWVLAIPMIGWPLLFLGLGHGWWGYGLGEEWYYPLIVFVLVGMAVAAAGVLLRRRLSD